MESRCTKGQRARKSSPLSSQGQRESLRCHPAKFSAGKWFLSWRGQKALARDWDGAGAVVPVSSH